MRRMLLSVLLLVCLVGIAARVRGRLFARAWNSVHRLYLITGGGCIAVENWTGTLRASVTGPATFAGGTCAVSSKRTSRPSRSQRAAGR